MIDHPHDAYGFAYPETLQLDDEQAAMKGVVSGLCLTLAVGIVVGAVAFMVFG